MARSQTGRSKGKRKAGTARTPRRSARGGNGARANGRSTSTHAIDLLKADHRQVEQWFEEFESSRSARKKQELAQKICKALTVHAQIEEELFYPAFLEATGDRDMHHEAAVEHDGAKKLIAEIEGSGPDDDYFDARVSVLSEMVKHHVREEEKRDGMFAQARQSDMDLRALGEQLKARRDELMSRGPGSLRGRAGFGRRMGRGVGKSMGLHRSIPMQ